MSWMGELRVLERRLRESEANVRILREMLYNMTSLTDWQQAGYSADEYEVFCAAYERDLDIIEEGD